MEAQIASYPTMPLYTQDHAAYSGQMYEWHLKMARHYEEQRAHHLERATLFQNVAGSSAYPIQRTSGGATSSGYLLGVRS
jgi:hypothetical protein